MRVLVVNSNTSEAITQSIAAVATAAASCGTIILPRTAEYGPRYISSRAEATVAALATVEAIAAAGDQVDAAVIAAFVDPGLAACRELFSFPIVGVAEAAMITSLFYGGRFAIVTTGPRVVPVFEDLAATYGVAGRLAAIEAIEDRDIDPAGHPDHAAEALAAVGARCIERHFAEVIVLGGAPLAGLRDRVQARLPVPVLDGVSCGVRMAEALVGLKIPKARAGSYAHPGRRAMVGLSEPLAALFERAP